MNKELLKHYRDKLKDNNFKTKRTLFTLLKKTMENHNIVLIGLRQLGKTILAEQLVKDYLDMNNSKKDNKTLSSEEHFLYLNLKVFNKITSEDIQVAVNGKNYKVVLIDEVQVIKRWSNMAQVLVDMNPDTRFVFTGSNAFALSQESAFQRVKSYNIYPLSFDEYKTIGNRNDFNEYLYFGSYPKSRNYNSARIQYFEMVYEMIIDKIATVDNTGVSVSKLRNFSKKIANYIGGEINTQRISIESELSRPTVGAYIKIMKDASLIKTITKFNDRQVKPKRKVYFTDKSMLPHFIGKELNANQLGSLIENLVFMTLASRYDLKYASDEIQFYKNKNNKEIDFIIPNKKMLVEVKCHEELNYIKLAKELNERLILEVQDYEKIVVTKHLNINYGGWKFMSLLEYIKEV